MKRVKIINILLIFIFAVFLFQGYDVSARTKGYDTEIKSEIAQIRNAIEICFDDNGGSYEKCGDLESVGLGDYASSLKPPDCSDDERYNIVISEDGQKFAIWADLATEEGYWCLDYDRQKIVKNNITPTDEDPVCPDNGDYFKRDNNMNNCKYDNTNNDLDTMLLYSIIILTILIVICKTIVEAINARYLNNKLEPRDIKHVVLVGLLKVPFSGILYLIILKYVFEKLLFFDSSVGFSIYLSLVIFLIYISVKKSLNRFIGKISSKKARNLSIFIMIYCILIICLVLFGLSCVLISL